jgi:hypothetical protein
METMTEKGSVYAWGDSLIHRASCEFSERARTGVELSMVVGVDRLEQEMAVLRSSGWEILSFQPYTNSSGVLIEARKRKT